MSETAPDKPSIAIFGNSNSVLRSSYARKLAAFTQFEVRNYSVGACPNASLLFSLTQAADHRVDYIIVEPAVTDAEWLRLGLYDRPTLDRNFREFIRQARSLWQAQIILLILPTKQELKDPAFSPRAYYRSIADELDLSFIDFYSVYEQFFAADRNVEWMFFEDELHLSPSLFNMLADILWSLILGHEASRRGQPRPAGEGKTSCLLAHPQSRRGDKDRAIVRSTSLITQSFLRLEANDTITFKAERDSLLTSLVVNRQVASAVAEITSDRGHVLHKDLRLRPDARGEFTLHIVPLLKELRGRSFRMRLMLPMELTGLNLAPTNFADPAPPRGTLELCGAVLIDAASAANGKATANGARPPAGGNSILRLNFAGVPASAIDTRIRARLEPLKMVMQDFLEFHVVFSKARFGRTVDWLMGRIAQAESLQPADVLTLVGDAMFILKNNETATRLLNRARELRPDDPRAQDLLRRIAREAHSR